MAIGACFGSKYVPGKTALKGSAYDVELLCSLTYRADFFFL
jgi:hypothetical protein